MTQGRPNPNLNPILTLILTLTLTLTLTLGAWAQGRRAWAVGID